MTFPISTKLFWTSAAVAGLLVSGLLLVHAQTRVQDEDLRQYLDLLRSDVSQTKIRTLNEVMKISGEEAEKFWPVYQKYETELQHVSDQKLALLNEFAGYHVSGTLGDKAAKNLAERWLKNSQDRLDLWKKYHKRISKAVSPIRAAQFLQVENQMALFIDLNIAAEMPAVGTKEPFR
jgi:hypothetical protein